MSDLDFEQRQRLEAEVLPATVDDPEYAAATIVRYEKHITDLEAQLAAKDAEIAALQEDVTRQMQVANEAVNNAWCPERCPITMRLFFMWIEHPEMGYVPTYGGPYDSYTIAEPSNLPDDGSPVRWEDIEFVCARYDHDVGGWVDSEDPSMRVVSEDRLCDLMTNDSRPHD